MIVHDCLNIVLISLFKDNFIIKDKLGRDYHSLPVGKNGRDDEEMILCYFKIDQSHCIQTVTIFVLSTVIYVHDSLDVYGRPVLVVVASKHFPAMHNPVENEKLCHPAGKEQILGILDLRGFSTENTDFKFLTFLVILTIS
ncbi:hypothetical protein POPTR_012G088350v4 [Populus trichocarpa]|uniref:Uncharacterized protein n=1 Tax=Populus trichocarpa TaxID=3694 RepID=A0ACC0S679_POPTR|nr:hypothetical protein POPTR_012G088350v4 [Populus trichocarpa]